MFQTVSPPLRFHSLTTESSLASSIHSPAMSQSELSDRELASTAMGLSRDKRRGDYISRPFQAEWMLTWASDLALSLLWSLPRDGQSFRIFSMSRLVLTPATEVLELNARLSLMLQKDIIAVGPFP